MKKMLLCVAALIAAVVVACGPRDAAAQADSRGSVKPLRVLLITGGCCHDYDAQKKILSEGIAARANVEFDIVHEGGKSLDHKVSVYSNPGWANNYDVVLHNECFANVTDKAFVEGILKPHHDGKGAVVLHCSMHCYRVPEFDGWFDFCGVTSRRHVKQEPIQVSITNHTHPVTKGLGTNGWTTPNGELYVIEKVWEGTTVLGEGSNKQSQQPLIWAHEYGKGRVFGTTLGHHNETMQQKEYLDLVTRGVLWAAGKIDANGKIAPGYGK